MAIFNFEPQLPIFRSERMAKDSRSFRNSRTLTCRRIMKEELDDSFNLITSREAQTVVLQDLSL